MSTDDSTPEQRFAADIAQLGDDWERDERERDEAAERFLSSDPRRATDGE